MSQLFPATAVRNLEFCPYEDVLGIGHARGIETLIVPGSGEGSYDSLEMDPFESKKARREREVIALMDKIQPDQITVDPDMIGRVRASQAAARDAGNVSLDLRGITEKTRDKQKAYREISRIDRVADEDDESRETDDAVDSSVRPSGEIKVKKPRGRNKVLKKLLRKRKTIIDEKSMRVAQLIAERKAAKQGRQASHTVQNSGSALSRFS